MMRVDVVKIMLYPGKKLNMQVVYTIDPTYSPSVLKDMLKKACMVGITNVTVYLSTYEDESYVENVDGVTMSGNHQFKYSTIEGIIVTKQTIKNRKDPLRIVIAVGIDESNLHVLEDRRDVLVVVVINQNIANVDSWLKLYDAKNANTGRTRMQGMVVDPLLNRVIGWLKQISVESTPLYDFKRDDYLRMAANLLKMNKVGYNEDVVAAQCIKRGLDAKSARAVASVFEKAIKSHGYLTIKNGNPNYSAMLDMVDDEKYEKN